MTTFRVTVPLLVEARDANEARRKAYEAITEDPYFDDRTDVPVVLSLEVSALVQEMTVHGRVQPLMPS